MNEPIHSSVVQNMPDFFYTHFGYSNDVPKFVKFEKRARNIFHFLWILYLYWKIILSCYSGLVVRVLERRAVELGQIIVGRGHIVGSRPYTGGSRPTFGGSRPNTGRSRPHSGDSRPHFGGARPNYGG